jgi:hypothetical protein
VQMWCFLAALIITLWLKFILGVIWMTILNG